MSKYILLLTPSIRTIELHNTGLKSNQLHLKLSSLLLFLNILIFVPCRCCSLKVSFVHFHTNFGHANWKQHKYMYSNAFENLETDLYSPTLIRIWRSDVISQCQERILPLSYRNGLVFGFTEGPSSKNRNKNI